MIRFDNLDFYCMRLDYSSILDYCPNFYEIREYLYFLKEKNIENDILNICINHSIMYCNLIEYIANYSENNKNEVLDKELEKYDIKLYHITYKNDIENKIYSNDVYKLVKTLNINLDIIKSIVNNKEISYDAENLEFPLCKKKIKKDI